MKITRAYTIDIETKRILDRKPNKSQYVCRAVKKLDQKDGEDDIPLMEADDKTIILELKARFDIHSPQYQLLTTIMALL